MNVSQFIEPQQLSFCIKFFGVTALLLTIFTFLSFTFEKKSNDIKMGRVKPQKVNWAQKIAWLNSYYKNLHTFCLSKDKEHLVGTLFSATLIALVGVFGFLIAMKQLVLAIGFPLILLKFLDYIVAFSTRHTIEDIEEQLPSAIDKFIRVSTKNDDIKKILYTTSLDLEEPLKSIFDGLAIKMSSGYKTDALMDLGNRYNNIWVWSFVFILIGYSTNTAKAETVESLRNLRILLEGENLNQKNQARERKYGVAINYTLIAIAFVGFILNLIFNPIAKEFFFASLGGLLCLAGGFGSIFVTIIVNIKMVKRK